MRAPHCSNLTLAGAILLLLTSSALAGQLPVDRDSINWRKTRGIIDFMRLYGHPDSVEGNERLRIYHWKRIATMAFSDDDGVESYQKFECEVTAKVAVGGPILQVKADVANAGALAIASVGGFGSDCAKTFGFRNTRRPVAPERMRR